MRTAFPYEPQKTIQLASPIVNWSVLFTSGSGSATLWPGAVAPVKVLGEELEFDLIEKRALKRMIDEAEARWQWQTVIPSAPVSEVPEVFSLSPLSRRRICIRVRKVEPAPFHFVTDDDTHLEVED